MTTLPSELAALSHLGKSRLPAADYYAPLLDSEDEVVRVGAWSSLLDRQEVPYALYPRLVDLSRYGAIQLRAFRFLEANWEHDLAAQVMAQSASTEAAALSQIMRAELAFDDAAAVDAHRQRYLAIGRMDALIAMTGKAELAGGWRDALPLAVQMLLVYPHDPMAAKTLLQYLQSAKQRDLLVAALAVLESSGLHPYLVQLYRASAKLMGGDPKGALAQLQSLSGQRPVRADVMSRVRFLPYQVAAESHEKVGNYRKAYEAYVELNKADDGPPIKLTDFGDVMRAAGALDVPPLPPDPRVSTFMMTGFPRSGTTLLENALAMHPSIETFEEIPSRSSMQLYLDHALPLATTEPDRVGVFVESRRRYYDEMDRRQKKRDASILVDKMPLRSAEARFLVKAFPDKRYIFSIRHPFDVVLSCFKQYFSRNIAMEHFRSFDTAVKLYDFTMTEWFAAFTMDDPRVHYLRYDTLVENFEPSVRDALTFLGAEWDDSILDFAAGASTRGARTPSYQKVRQGLSIGVQSSWRNYGFLFQSPEAKPLHRWAEFFGYPTK